MARIVTWAANEIQQNLSTRLRDAMSARLRMESRWTQTERVVFNTKGEINSYPGVGYDSDILTSSMDASDNTNTQIGINYVFKNLSYIHSQMASNPPSVVPRPSSNDFEDRRKADAADRVCRHALREYQMQEYVDKATLNTLIYGVGIVKSLWDAEIGDVLEVDEETGEMVMEGDYKISVPTPWAIYIDGDASTMEEVRFIFEKIQLPYEEALFRWPEKKDILQKYRKKAQDSESSISGNKSAIAVSKYDIVELFEYWEKGLPVNGYLGRFCVCSVDGQLITELLPNPERYQKTKKNTSKDIQTFNSGTSVPPVKKIEMAVLPYEILTDLDVPGSVWGKARAEYSINIQDMMNRLDSMSLEQAQAHGVPRLLLPEGSEVADDSITNSPWDIVKYTGNMKPDYMEPSPIPPILPELLARYKTGIDDSFGVNEAMFGQQSREQSGFSMQYATQQGNIIRFRLMNKYHQFCVNLYKSFLRIVTKHWDIPRSIYVIGKEKAFEAMDLKGTDIDGGYDLTIEYGASSSIDPTARREEIITLMPAFEKAGVDQRQIMRMLKLNELDGMYDMLDLATDRQQEIFQEMMSTGMYIPPGDVQDHANMLKHCYYYVMTSEFKYLTDDDKALIIRHIKEREQLEASRQAAGAGVATQAMQPLGGSPPGPLPSSPIQVPPTQGAPGGAPAPLQV